MPTASSTSVPPHRPRGFAIADYASRAAKKGHALGSRYCHEWTPAEARAASRKAVEARRRKRETAVER